MDTLGDIHFVTFGLAKLMVDTIADTRNEESKGCPPCCSSQHNKCITRAYRPVKKEVETTCITSLRERFKLFKTLSWVTYQHRQSSRHFATHCRGVKQKRQSTLCGTSQHKSGSKHLVTNWPTCEADALQTNWLTGQKRSCSRHLVPNSLRKRQRLWSTYFPRKCQRWWSRKQKVQTRTRQRSRFLSNT